MKEITKKAKPNTKVILLSNNSEPLSFWLENNSLFPPVIIWLASDALLLCNKTIAISNIDIIIKGTLFDRYSFIIAKFMIYL